MLACRTILCSAASTWRLRRVAGRPDGRAVGYDASEVRIVEMGVGQVGSAQVGLPQDCASQIGTLQVSRAQICVF